MNNLINESVAALNNLGGRFCDFATSMFVQAGVLIVALLIIELLIRKRVRATFRYWMWMLVFVKLLLPPTLSLPTGIGYWLGDYFRIDHVAAPQPPHVAPFEPREQPAPSAPAKASYEPATLTIPDPPTPTATSHSPVAPSLNALTWQGVVFGLWVLGVLTITALLVQRMFFVKGMISRANLRTTSWLKR